MIHGEPETVTLTADVVLFGYRDDLPHVLLVRRVRPPFADFWALPGGKVDPGERVYDAAWRELAEETGIRVPSGCGGILGVQRGAFVPGAPMVTGKAPPTPRVGTYSDPGRDPRGRYVTQVWAAVLDDTPEPTAWDGGITAASWKPLVNLPPYTASALAFDHAEILDHAIARILDGFSIDITVPKGQRYDHL